MTRINFTDSDGDSVYVGIPKGEDVQGAILLIREAGGTGVRAFEIKGR